MSNRHRRTERPTILGRLARSVTDHAALVVLAGLLFAVLAGIFGASLLSLTSNQIGDPAAESAQALTRVAAASGTGLRPTDIVLVIDVPQAWPSDADLQIVSAAAARLRSTSGVVTVVDPTLVPDGSGLISGDRRSVLVTAGISATVDQNAVATSVRTSFAADAGVAVGGAAVVSLEIDERISHDLEWAETFAFPILLVLSIWVFRGAVAAIIPVMIGVFSIVAALAGLRGVAEFLSLSQYVLNLVIGLGLGLAIDYCLFMISRYREEILVDGYGVPAVIRTVQHAGRTVLLSASTVACALATLLLFPQKFLYSMGIGGVLVTAAAALGAVVGVPAMLILLGPRINSLAPPRWLNQQEQESTNVTAGRWYRLSAWVMGHAKGVLAGSLVVAALFAFPALFTTFGDVDQSSLPTSSVPRQVSDRIAADFSGGGSDIYLVATAADSAQAAVGSLSSSALAAAGPGAALSAPDHFVGQGLWVISLTVPGSPFGADAGDAVVRIRALPGTVPFLVGGDAASFVDLKSSVGSHLPSVLVIVALAVLVVMFLVTGSVVLAVKTLVLNALNVAMTFGVLVWIFQYGHLEWLLQFQSTQRIDLTQPILVAVIAFGLSTDYGVFLFARIREAHDQGLHDVEAVSAGIGRSGRLISSAALLLAVAIGAFSSSSILFVKQLGVGAAVAVFLDATLVRAFLVPSAMKLMRSANWWAPKWMVKVHSRFGISEAPAKPTPALSSRNR